MGDKAAVLAVEGPGPIVANRFIENRLLVEHQFGLERGTGLERTVLQYAVAEAVNRADCGFVEGLQRCADATAVAVAMGGARGEPGSHGLVRLGGTLEHLGDRLQAPPHAVAKLGRGGLGERDHQNLADSHALLDHQPYEERGDRVGLAGPGTGLDEVRASQRQPKGVEGLGGHRGTSSERACSIGQNTRVATVPKSPAVSGPSNGV